MFLRLLRLQPAIFFIVIALLFSSANVQAKEVEWRPNGEGEAAFSFNLNVGVITSYVQKKVEETAYDLVVIPSKNAAGSARNTIETIRLSAEIVSNDLTSVLRTTGRSISHASNSLGQGVLGARQNLTLLTPKIELPNLSLSLLSLGSWNRAEKVEQREQQTDKQALQNPLHSQEGNRQDMRSSLFAQAANPSLPTVPKVAPATGQPSLPAVLSDRDILKQEIIREVVSSLPKYSSFSAQSPNISSLKTEIANDVRSLISKQSQADSTRRTTIIQNITTSGTLTSPAISGATITSSTFSGTTGAFTSLASDSGDFDSLCINGDCESSWPAPDLSLWTSDVNGGGYDLTNVTDLSVANATTTNFFSTTASSTNLITSNLTFGGVTGGSWTDFCTTITGSSALCDGTDDTATTISG